jgi:hypothetical protein
MNAQPLCLSCLPDGIFHHHHKSITVHFSAFISIVPIYCCVTENKHIIIIIIIIIIIKFHQQLDPDPHAECGSGSETLA